MGAMEEIRTISVAHRKKFSLILIDLQKQKLKSEDYGTMTTTNRSVVGSGPMCAPVRRVR